MTDVMVPSLGESVTEATVSTWFKKPGDVVKVDEMLCELETDKVSVEVPSPVAGVLAEIIAPEGTTVPAGARLAIVTEGASAAVAAPKAVAPVAAPAAPAERTHTVKKGETLGKLAARYYGKSAEWQRIAKANPQVGPDGAKLSLGMTLTIPPR